MQLKHIISFFLLVTVLVACKKDNNTPEADVFYAVSIEGYDVTFTNTTTGAVSYKWDFGDSTTSTEANPVHTYPGKGKYVPTLYATTKEGRVAEASTVVYIAKSSPVKLDDNTLADWNEITTSETIAGAGETYFKKMKIDYDGNYIYFYFEMNSNKNNGDIFDFYLDTDNDATTGYLTGTFPDGGYDVLLEGNVLVNWFDAFYHSGAQDAFDGFKPTSVAEFYTVGTVVQDGTTLKFEMRIARSKIKGLSAAKAFRAGIQASNSGWSVIGSMPDGNQPSVLVSLE